MTSKSRRPGLDVALAGEVVGDDLGAAREELRDRFDLGSRGRDARVRDREEARAAESGRAPEREQHRGARRIGNLETLAEELAGGRVLERLERDVAEVLMGDDDEALGADARNRGLHEEQEQLARGPLVELRVAVGQALTAVRRPC